MKRKLLFKPLESEPLVRNWIIPDRDKNASDRLIDLTDYYTGSLDDDWMVSAGSNLKRLPKGIQQLDGVKFDIRGVVQLGGINMYKESDYTKEEQKKHYPQKVNGIKINQKASVIYFLHASAWGEEKNKEVGQYVIQYEDGTSGIISLKYLDVFRDWWYLPDEEMPTNATKAWNGLNDLAEKKGSYQIALFNYKWENPFSDKTIKTIDFISTMTTAAPFLIAVTLGE
jgi:beta-galactosidase